MPLRRAIAFASGVASEAHAFECAVVSQWLYWLPAALPSWHSAQAREPTYTGCFDRLRPQGDGNGRHRRQRGQAQREDRGAPHGYFFPGSTRSTCPPATSFHSSVVPSGHRTDTRSAFSAAPRPKCARVSPCER